jgi:hypothetical protein
MEEGHHNGRLFGAACLLRQRGPCFDQLGRERHIKDSLDMLCMLCFLFFFYINFFFSSYLMFNDFLKLIRKSFVVIE